MMQPEIDVGIVLCEELNLLLANDFISEHGLIPAGEYNAVFSNNQISVTDNEGKKIIGNSFLLSPAGEFSYSFFELKDVTIGGGFHWEQKENQRFKGKLKITSEGGKIRAINRIRIEDYLESVISSEMSAASSLEFLKAHAVISRSWLMAQINKTNLLRTEGGIYETSFETEDEITRWYDREDHLNFDVCADDHCQRYQGITRISTEKVIRAVSETNGEVLVSDNRICDTRFSKCCGGITENFENVWEPVRYRYLTKRVDSENADSTCVDLRKEDEADAWIRTFPYAFCNTTDKHVLSQVLPEFDQKTIDFFRWKVEYTQDVLAAIIKKRSGIDFGNIIKLEPVQRGHSGRLIKLKIHGTKKTLTLGKELEIRKWLSESHLLSSAFIIDHLDYENGIPKRVVLTGAGWGHGVGLCQIGAAVMGEKGYQYAEILSHYFRGAELKKIY